LRRLDVLRQQSAVLTTLYPRFEAPELAARLRDSIVSLSTMEPLR